jgi:hypothetical protein
MKFSREVMAFIEGEFDVILLISYLQPFQNGDVQTSEVDAKFAPVDLRP